MAMRVGTFLPFSINWDRGQILVFAARNHDIRSHKKNILSKASLNRALSATLEITAVKASNYASASGQSPCHCNPCCP
ncbi:hypothetical protein T4D_13939 [Trichinella pseudospiralis]|uniref:Uncharacterized protein n=1 Tax=Trichinella pseudospiralis TaxID=6337 RepID=A0A0V1G0R7_TRIPS|nr:hypothetical protein T4D_13939 [Trichinella pseudospiralis]